MFDFKEGDIVVCGRTGWWRVKSKDLHKSNRLMLELIMDGKGNVPKKTPRTFSAYANWCKIVTLDDVKKQREESKKMWDTLLFILDPEQEIDNKEIKDLIKKTEKSEPDFLLNLPIPQSLAKK